MIQSIEKGDSIQNIDPIETLSAGGKSAAIAAFTSLLVPLFSFWGETALWQLGAQINDGIFMGGKVNLAFKNLAAFGAVVGKAAGFIVGAAVANELGSSLFGVLPGIKEDVKSGITDWIKEIVKRLLENA